ncbi:uncharacterized protein JN550_011246 [Neoarthrinium moseri]|uniref:uncharacterized protein n=1 Tax=Neoarthrinium moseri TaxID=1658444 RepID=UPI001FDE9720|nr:uncharacterized protein JN550_011246 [Neoarthrinium moseri]KAI1860784.1 hypothetical protein JN550_011246 [Neoarthrinium moseri]
MSRVLLNGHFRAAALLVNIISSFSTAEAQQFPDGLLGYSSYPGLSDSCAEALNTTVASCSVFLASVAVDMPRLASSLLDVLCTADCRSSLTSVRNVIAAGCSTSTDVLEIGSVVYPATFVIENLLYAFDVSCTKDSDTGMFCDQIYMDALANGTEVDSCSDCALSVVSKQLSSPFGYHPQFAEGFQSVTSRCGATGYAFTSPAPYAVSTKPSAQPTDAPTCTSPYTVQEGDTCDSIATSKGVSTLSIVKAGRTDPDCTTLQVGANLCLPEPCTVYRVQYDDTCQSIIDSVEGLRATDLLTWNANINPLCSNLGAIAKSLICISPPGRTLADVTSITEAPTATQAPPTPVPRPANAKAESNARCAGWYEVQAGDYCQAISIRQAIALQDFFFLNPSIDQPDCNNLWLETSYCIKPVGDINTYSDYPYSTSPVYTLTSSSYVTTAVSLVPTVAPIATPIVELSLAPGSATEADGCLGFVSHHVVVPQMDQSLQTDVPTFNNTINSCYFAIGAYEFDLNEFLSWNPSLQSVNPCYLQEGYRYCGDHKDATPDLPRTGTCLPIEEPHSGTISSCSCFTIIKGYEATSYSCEDIADDHKVTVSNLMAWNPWIGDQSSCDTGIYADLEESADRPVCVGVDSNGGGATITRPPSTTTTEAPITTSTSVSPGAPTQTGIVESCVKYYVAQSGDGCWAIANDNAIALDNFYAWNPAVGTDCANLWPGYAYCVQGPASSPTTSAMPTSTSGGVSPPGPTQDGASSSCKQWHTVVDGDGCWAIANDNGIALDDFYSWNPSIGSNCENLWLGYSVCVGV